MTMTYKDPVLLTTFHLPQPRERTSIRWDKVPLRPTAQEHAAYVEAACGLTVTIKKMGNWYIAQCHEHDLVTNGRTLDEAANRWELALWARVIWAHETGLDPWDNVLPPPSEALAQFKTDNEELG